MYSIRVYRVENVNFLDPYEKKQHDVRCGNGWIWLKLKFSNRTHTKFEQTGQTAYILILTTYGANAATFAFVNKKCVKFGQ